LSDKKLDNVNISSPGTSQSNINLTKVTEIDTLRTRLCTYIDNAENYYVANYQDKWNYFDNLYEGRREKPEGAAPWRSNIASQLCFQSVQDELPKSLDGLIGDGDFFTFQPRPGKEHKLLKAQAYADLVRYFYDKADFFSKTHDAMLYSKQLGIGFVKQTWRGDYDIKEKYVENEGEVALETTEKFEQGLFLEILDPNRAYPDPDAESMEEINKCGYFVEYTWITRDYIEDMKEKTGSIKKEINDFMSLANEQEQFERYQLYCVYTAKEVYWLVTGNGADYVVRRMKNPYDHGHVPVYPIYKFRKPGYIIGTGIVEKLADLSEASSDALNMFFDNWLISVNSHIAVKDDITIDANLQNIEPGGISRWNNPREDINVLKLGSSNPGDMAILQTFMGLASQTIGTSTGITTPQGIQTMNNKTATGASILAYNEAQSISLEVKINRDSYLKKILRDGIDLINQYITDEMVKRILPPEKAVLIRVAEDKDTFWDDFDFIIKGETGYVGKQREMEKATQILQLIPAVEQVATAVPTFNKKMYYEMVFGMMDVPKDIVKSEPEAISINMGDYTPQEQERINALSQQIGVPVPMIMEMLDKGMTLEQIVAKAQEAKDGLSQQGGVQSAQQVSGQQPVNG
jgi:hypothetical protein